MLDRYLIRYFTAVVDQGNFSRAAQACHVAQPTLSVGIAKLERLIGRRLLIRSNQRVELTEAGTRFLAHARRIEREFNIAMRAMEPVDTGVPFRLGVLASIPTPPVAAAIAETRPGATDRFELLFGSERELIGHLAKGRIDIALTLVRRGADRFAERAILTEGYALALSAGHRLAERAAIAPDEIAQETMIVRRHCEALSETSRFFLERGVRPHFSLKSTNDERVLQMVAAGLGLTVMPDCHAQNGVARPRLTGFTARRTIGWMAGHDAEHLLTAPRPVMTALEGRLNMGGG